MAAIILRATARASALKALVRSSALAVPATALVPRTLALRSLPALGAAAAVAAAAPQRFLATPAKKKASAAKDKTATMAATAETEAEADDDADVGGKNVVPDESSDEDDGPPDYLPVTLPAFAKAEENINKFLNLGQDLVDALSSIPLPRDFEDSFVVYGGPHVLYRDETHALLESMDKLADQSNKTSRSILLDGPTGCGKSMTLLSAVQYARSQGWAVIYVPEMMLFAKGKYFFLEVEGTDKFAQNEAMFDLLTIYNKLNEAVFNKLTTKNDWTVGNRGTVPAGSPLYSLVSVGLDEKYAATDVMLALLKELTEETRVPVLFALDGLDLLFDRVFYMDENSKPLPMERFVFFHELAEMSRGKLVPKRGVFIGALTTQHRNVHGQFKSPRVRFHRDTGELLPHSYAKKPWLDRNRIPDETTYHLTVNYFTAFEADAVGELMLRRYNHRDSPYILHTSELEDTPEPKRRGLSLSEQTDETTTSEEEEEESTEEDADADAELKGEAEAQADNVDESDSDREVPLQPSLMTQPGEQVLGRILFSLSQGNGREMLKVLKFT